MSDVYTIGLTVAGWLATTWFAYRWGLHSQREQRAAATHSRLREAFSSLRISVVNGNISRTRLTELEGGQESVITEFRVHLSRFKRAAFDGARLKYYQCCHPDHDPTPEPGRLGEPRGFDPSEFERAMRDTFSSHQRSELVTAIDALLDFADKT